MKISVIIPIYNMSRYMRDCFDSIRAQTFTDWEAICVDDGSTDDSAKIIDEYMAKDARFRVVHKENGGLSTARNAGLEVAKGEWYTFVDPDDTIVPEWFAHAVELMSDKVDLVRLAVIGNLKWYAERTPVLRGLDASRWCWNVFSGDCPTWLCFVRLNRIGDAQFRTNLRFSEDKLFMLEITPALRGVVQGDFRGYNYRSVEGSLTGKRRPASHCVAFLMACADIWRAQREWAKKLGILDLVRDSLQSIVDTDIREWAIMMPPAGGGGGAEDVRRAYIALEREGAVASGWRHRQSRVIVPFFIWRWTGCFAGYKLLAFLTKSYRQFIGWRRRRKARA